ncbi:hypothetical protein SNE35_03700 [Paucibacter sp. R3-3]|uniref:Lipoprotein n=1 Tax=Roseateles agri TaxID=3098619 RepID=A0ABU5DBD7_9BURK|nr:hypothetical protein [Paucibacter sp. R3-3]MDY0743591.1 hypothetical protein [Paucibacter sp. R3-3]
MMTKSALALSSLLLVSLLSGCDQLGIEDPAKVAAAKEADGKAIGSACRHANRAIEDCYTLNPKAQKAAVFAGWKEMDAYMRENKIEGIAPVVPRPSAIKPSAPAADADDGDSAPAAKGH